MPGEPQTEPKKDEPKKDEPKKEIARTQSSILDVATQNLGAGEPSQAGWWSWIRRSAGVLVVVALAAFSWLLPWWVIIDEVKSDHLWVNTDAARVNAWAWVLSAIPSMSMVHLVLCIVRVQINLPSTSGEEEPAAGFGRFHGFRALYISKMSTVLSALVLMYHLRKAAEVSLKEEYRAQADMLITRLLGLLMFLAVEGATHSITREIRHCVKWKENMVFGNSEIQKWQKITHGLTLHLKPEKNAAYSYANKSRLTAASTLAEIARVYTWLARAAAFVILVLHFIGVDIYENMVIFGTTVIFTGVITSLHLKDAVSNLLPLALTNPFFVGELISLSRPGSPPADNPKANLTGFVEAITWAHIVIRDFRKKQVHVPHSAFSELVLHNWSRRPAKHCHTRIMFTMRQPGSAIAVAQLAKFCRDWIGAHPNVDQKGYKNCRSDMKANGLMLESVFFPRDSRVNIYQLRTEYMVFVTEAAARLNLQIIHDEKARALGPDPTPVAAEAHPFDLDELPDFDDLMPHNQSLHVKSGYVAPETKANPIEHA